MIGGNGKFTSRLIGPRLAETGVGEGVSTPNSKAKVWSVSATNTIVGQWAAGAKTSVSKEFPCNIPREQRIKFAKDIGTKLSRSSNYSLRTM